MKVLLLNPPGDALAIRDLYCSISSKATYYWQPADLAAASGLLAERHDLSVLDAMVERLSPARALERALACSPDAVLSLTGSSTWPGDFAFLSSLKAARPGLRVAVSGDLSVGQWREVLERHACVDACLLDFTSPSLGRWLEEPESGPLPDLAYRGPSGVVAPAPDEARGAELRLGRARHELFPLSRYRLPYARGPVATVLTGFACPYRCSFCIQSAHVMTYRWRPAAEVLEELRAVRALGLRSVLFRDPLFEANRKNALALCRAMAAERLGLEWSCNSRVDTLDEELAAAMSAAGCRMVLFGLESASDKTLSALGKGSTVAQAERAIALCRKHGIGVSGYFILGMPPETREDALRTIDRAVGWDLDFASFAAPSPDYGTPLRREALAAGRLDEGLAVFDRSEAPGFSGALPGAEVEELLRLAYRRFYMRPAWLARRLRLSAGSPEALWRLGRDGLEVARRAFS